MDEYKYSSRTLLYSKRILIWMNEFSYRGVLHRNSPSDEIAIATAAMASTSLSLPRPCKLHQLASSQSSSCSSSSSYSSCFFRPSCAFVAHVKDLQWQQPDSQKQGRKPGPVSVRAETTQAKGLSVEQGGQWLSSTTRHVRIYAGYIDPVTKVMDQSQLDKLTLMLDPDNEFLWPEDKVQEVYRYFKELVDNYAGADLSEYTLRLIGSDIEHYIRKMLLAGELKYNLECRVLNFSMGKPRIDPTYLDDVEEEE